MSAIAIVGAAALTADELERPALAELLAGERPRAVGIELRLLLAAVRQALHTARSHTNGLNLDPDALGVVVATHHAGLQAYVELFLEGTRAERPRVRPTKGPQSGLTAPAAEVSIRLPAAGPNATVCNGAVGGFDALRYAADRLAASDAETMLACELDLAPAAVHGRTARHVQRAAAAVLAHAPAVRADSSLPWAQVRAVATAFSPVGDAAEAQTRARVQALAEAGVTDAEASPRTARGDGPIAQLVEVAADFARGGERHPQLLVAHEGGAAGAAVLHPSQLTG